MKGRAFQVISSTERSEVGLLSMLILRICVGNKVHITHEVRSGGDDDFVGFTEPTRCDGSCREEKLLPSEMAGKISAFLNGGEVASGAECFDEREGPNAELDDLLEHLRVV